MRRAPKASPPIYVRVTKDGKEYEGEYYTTRGLVTVRKRKPAHAWIGGAALERTVVVCLR